MVHDRFDWYDRYGRCDRFDELIFGSTFRKAVRRSLRPILAVPVAAGAYPWNGDASAYAVSDDRLLTAA